MQAIADGCWYGSCYLPQTACGTDPLAAYPNQPVNDSGPKRPQATKAAAAR